MVQGHADQKLQLPVGSKLDFVTSWRKIVSFPPGLVNPDKAAGLEVERISTTQHAQASDAQLNFPTSASRLWGTLMASCNPGCVLEPTTSSRKSAGGNVEPGVEHDVAPGLAVGKQVVRVGN